MNIHFLGTSASEGWPALFCRCDSCLKARELGGRNIRTRTSVLIDEILKIDFPPDTYHHVLRDNLDLGKVQHLFFTHSHRDHLFPDDIGCRLTRHFAKGIDRSLHIYGNDLVLSKCKEPLAASYKAGLWHPDDYFGFHLLTPYLTMEIGTENGIYKVTPLLADHDPNETCLLYYIEKKGKTLLYAHDTGWLPEATWKWLDGKQIDMAIFDCTGGHDPNRPKGQRPRGHLNIDAVIEIVDVFRHEKMMTEKSQVVATHFSHEIGLTHEELVQLFEPYGIQAAYDSMRVEL